MACWKTFYIIVFALGQLFTRYTFADELMLHNGSRLIGSVVKKEDGILKLKTDFAGTLNVRWDAVKALKSDKSMTIMLKSKEIILSRVIRNSGEITTIVTDDEESLRALKSSEVVFINPDSWRLGSGNKLSGQANLSLRAQRGNTDKDESDFDADLTWRRKRDRFNLFGEMEYDRDNKKKTVDKWRLLGNYNFFANEKLYYGLNAGMETDDFADLNNRISIGPLVGYQLFERKTMNLSIDAILNRVHEEFETEANNNYWSAGWSLNFDKYLFDDLFQFYHRQTGLPNLEENGNIVWNSWTGLRIPITKGFLISTEVKVEYDSGAATEANDVDTTYHFKIGYQW